MQKGFKRVCKSILLNGLNELIYFTSLPPTYQEKEKEQISIMFPLSLLSHSQILFTVDLEVS